MLTDSCNLNSMMNFEGVTGVALDCRHSSTCTEVEACCDRTVLMQSAKGLRCCAVVTDISLVAL